MTRPFAKIVLAAVLLVWPALSWAKTVSLPLTIDFPLLRSLLVSEAFTGPDESAVVFDENRGCKRLTISRPAVSREDGKIRCEVAVSLRLGFHLAGRCRTPVKWDGYLVLFQHPRIDPETWSLSFQTMDSTVLDDQRGRGVLLGVTWDLVKPAIEAYMDEIKISLLPPVNNLKRVIHPLFPPDLQDRAETLVSSMTPKGVRVFPDALVVDILAAAQTGPPKAPEQPGLAGEPEKIRRFVDLWEAWDSLFIRMITSLANRPLSMEDRQLLMDVLLENRYEFVSILEKKQGGDGLVRRQFLRSWKHLSPLFRRHLSTGPSRSLLGYLAFFTASDALAALDAVGPELGVEISRQGLVRMALLLADDPSVTLEYTKGVNSDLRTLFDMGPPPETGVPPAPSEPSGQKEPEPPNDDGQNKGPLSFLMNRLISVAHAAEAAPEQEQARQKKDIETYLFTPDKDMDVFLAKMKTLLKKTAEKTIQNAPEVTWENDDRPNLLPDLLLAVAWQESCFRQYVIKKGKPTYIRSYDGTSVGMMQINERVWRNFYETRALKWDTAYNAAAGGEILELYFRRYAVGKLKDKKDAPSLSEKSMAALVYAMYNGGPSQFSAFLKRMKTGKYYLIDRLFAEKWKWVEEGGFGRLSQCLLGK